MKPGGPKKKTARRGGALLRLLILALTVIVGVAIGLQLRGGLPTVREPRPTAGVLGASPSATPSPTPRQYKLSIPAQRARQYPGSPVTTEQPFEGRDGYRMGQISYYSDDLKIYAQAVAPTTPRPRGGYPTIILAHGYVKPTDYVTDEAFYTDFATDYARKGFLVLKPDFRGHGRSWGVPEGAYYSSGYTTDVLNLAASIRTYAPADTSRLAIVGHSMGGHVALEAALVRPNLFRAVVLAAGANGIITDMYRNWGAFSDYGDPITLGTRRRVIALFGEPNLQSDFWKAADPYTYLADLNRPVMILHSDDDNTVPYRFSVDLAAAFASVGHNVRFDTYRAGHSFSGEARERFINETSAFIMAKLPQ